MPIIIIRFYDLESIAVICRLVIPYRCIWFMRYSCDGIILNERQGVIYHQCSLFRWWRLATNVLSSCQLPDWGCPWFCPVSERNCLISRPTFTTTVPFPVQMSHLPALYLTSVLVIRRDVTSVVGASSSNNIRICGYVQMNWNFSGKRWW